MAKQARRPKPFDVADIRVRAIRGPRKDDPHSWYWQARRTADGTREAVWCGWGTQADVARALAPILAGEAPTKPRDETVERVRDLLEVWLAWQLERQDISESRKAGSEDQARHVVRLLGEVYLTRLDRDVIGDVYMRPRLAEGAATGTIRNELGTLVQAWRWGQAPSRDLCPQRQLERPPLRYMPRRSRYVPERGEFWAALDCVRNETARIALLVIGATGCRQMGIAGATWGDIHWTRRTITLSEKGHAARNAAIPQEVLDELAAFRPEGAGLDDPIIPWTLRTTREELRKAWRAACKAAGVRYAPVSKIRTMVENALFDAGADPGVVSAQLGHTPEVSLRHYRQAKESQVAAMADAAGLGRRPDPDVISLAERRRAKS